MDSHRYGALVCWKVKQLFPPKKNTTKLTIKHNPNFITETIFCDHCPCHIGCLLEDARFTVYEDEER